jgi:RNA polymerase sigma-70 factor (ECF subfamily)
MKKAKKLTKEQEVLYIDQAKTGDMSAFNYIFVDNMDTFQKAVGKYLYDIEEKNDMLSYIFEKVIRNIRKYKEHDNFQGWIATLSKNAAIDYLRHKKTVVKRESRYDTIDPDFLDHISTLTDYAESAEDAMIRQECYDKMYLHLNKLPEAYRTIVEMKADGKPIKEISAKTGMSESVVKNRFLKIQKTLKSAINAA